MAMDVSEMAGKSYECLDNCAMCCLCQPELSLDELARFRKLGLTAGLTRNHIQGYETEEPTAIKLRGGNGACHFLEGRRCIIHQHRPAFCRQFPVHVHALDRVQLNANLSCRGVTPGGDSLSRFSDSVISAIDREMMAGVLSEAQAAFDNFRSEATKAGVFQPPARLREAISALLPELSKPGGIGRLLAFADANPDLGGMPVQKISELVAESEPPEDLDEIARQGNYEQFLLDNPAWLPVYVDSVFRWRVYRSIEGKIQVLELEPDGSLVPESSFTMEEIILLEPDAEALCVFADYARLLNSRDQFLGYACHVCQESEYSDDLLTVYLGVMGTTLLDQWWRSCLAGKILGKDVLDKGLAEEGIRAFDMDCLDMPTIGIFF